MWSLLNRNRTEEEQETLRWEYDQPLFPTEQQDTESVLSVLGYSVEELEAMSVPEG